MARDQLRLLALLPALSMAVYLGQGLLVGGLGVGAARALLLLAGVATAFWGPMALGWLRRRRVRPPVLEALQRELGEQSSVQGVAAVLAARLKEATGAAAVAVFREGHLLAAVPASPPGAPSARFGLGPTERPFGEVQCHGGVRRAEVVPSLLRVGALALQNALLAEQASSAERARSQAQAQRDLQHRLTWTVTTQLSDLLEETRDRLEVVRLCAGTLPADVLTQDLADLSGRLAQLEAFVHANLRNANALQGPVSPQPLAQLSLPR